MDEDYNQQKEDFLDEIYGFIKSKSQLKIEEVIDKLNILIDTYESYFKDDDSDIDFITNLKQNKEWYEDALKQQEIFKIKTTKEEKKAIQQTASNLQFKYESSLWAKLFQYHSHHNELYGQALFHILIGITCNLQIKYKDNIINGKEHLILLQRSRTGKNSGCEFVEKILRSLKKLKYENNQILDERDFIFVKAGKLNDPTFLDRFIVENTKKGANIKKDADGNPIIIEGTLSKTDFLWYPEAGNLLNPASKDNSEAVDIHINLLEPNGSYRKELAGWQGSYTITKGGQYSLVGLSVPVKNIKQHLIKNGLIQRCLFVTRDLSREDRKKMRQLASYYSHLKENEQLEYDTQFGELLNILREYQKFSLLNKIKIGDEISESFRAKMNEYMEKIISDIEKENLSEENVEIIEDFVGNYNLHLLILSHHSALLRFSNNVELVDLEYSYNFLKETVKLFIPWIEESIVPNKYMEERNTKRKQIILAVKKKYAGESVKMSEVVNIIRNLAKCSYPTAQKILFTFVQEPHNFYKIDIATKMVYF